MKYKEFNENKSDIDKFYSCPDCPSMIDIIELNKNRIKFKCLKENIIKELEINEYLEKNNKYKKENINNDKCSCSINNNYISYCFECNNHLCNDCLKKRIHIHHCKDNIIEVKPTEEELALIKNLIKDNKIELKNLKCEIDKREKKYEKIINFQIDKINQIINEKIRINKIKEIEELNSNKKNYENEVIKIIEEYLRKIKEKKQAYIILKRNIINKYKNINKNYLYLYNSKKNKIIEKIETKINKKEYNEKIKKLTQFNRINEIIFNTYIYHSNNYFNAKNIINIINSYVKNDIIKNEKKIIELPNDEVITKEKYNKIIDENKKLIKEYNIKFKKEGINEITAIYNSQKNMYIFGNGFVENNKDNCVIIYKGKEYKLQSYFDFEDISNQKITLKLRGIYNIKNIQGIFCDCSNLIELPDIHLINTENFTDFSFLFYWCDSLKSLPDISKWNLSNANNMKYMFHGCKSLASLPDISKWNINKVTDLSNLFNNCESLKFLPDISNWKTKNVVNMENMFNSCFKLTHLPDISKWNISNVENISHFFYGCKSLVSLPDISIWNTNKIEKMSSMFGFCESLKSLPDISKWDVSNVTDMHLMFDICESLDSLPNLSKWNINKACNRSQMFNGCKSSLNIPKGFE